MRPTIMRYLEEIGLDWLAQLVPRPGPMYGVMLAMVTVVFLRRAQVAGLDYQASDLNRADGCYGPPVAA